MATFGHTNIVGEGFDLTAFGTLLVFPLFYITVPLMTLNLVIGVLSNALTPEDKTSDEVKAKLAQLEAKIDALAGNDNGSEDKYSHIESELSDIKGLLTADGKK